MNEMTTEREARILETAVNMWGDMQIVVAIEECSELTKALTKWLRLVRLPEIVTEERMAAAEANIREEMADVQIMLNQLSLMFGDTTEEEIAKLERLEARIEESK